MAKRRVIGEKRTIGASSVIDLDKLTLKELKKKIIKELSITHLERQAYLVTDPLTEKYIFWCRGQYRFISANIVNRMIARKQLFYYTDTSSRIRNMLLGKYFKLGIYENKNNLSSIPHGKNYSSYDKPIKPKKKRFIW